MDPYNGKAPFVAGSATSQAAAERVDPRAEWRVYDYIARCGPEGATDDEVEVALRMRHQTASARRRTLVLKLKVRATERTRRTRSGRLARVWVVSDMRDPLPQLELPGVDSSRSQS